MVKPIMIQDDFMYDFYLGCPKCKEPVHFPLTKEHPEKCMKCGEVFDWSNEKKGGESNEI